MQTNLIQAHIALLTSERRPKTSFWASESEKMLFDIYHEWMGTPYTNPKTGKSLIILEAGKQIEVSIVKHLQDAGFLKVTEEDQERIDIVREGAPISGKIDAMTAHGGIPIEIKSFYGYYQEKDIKAGAPNIGYVKQLAIYMDALNKDQGILLMVDRGAGNMYEFIVTRTGPLQFRCGKHTVNLDETYKKWGECYANNILKKIEPPIEHQYKVPPSKVDWNTVNKSDIPKYRAGSKVYSSHPFAIQYSYFKDLIIEKQGCGLGYTKEELIEVKRYTEHIHLELKNKRKTTKSQ